MTRNIGPSARERANGHWPAILAKAGLGEQQLSKLHASCPLCGGTDRFRFDDMEGRGTYYCNGCGPGDGFQLLMKLQGGGFREAAEYVEKFFGTGNVQTLAAPVAPVEKKDPIEERKRIAKKLQRTWDLARPVVKGDPVWCYLVQTRQLPLETIPACIRFHPGLPYYEDVKKDGKIVSVKRGTHPAMLAKVDSPAHKPVGLHRTYLTVDGMKAPYKKVKKLMKSLGLQGGAIRLFPVTGSVMGVAEGIETAFAAHLRTGIPVWATISSTIMASFEPPPGVTTVVIFSDNDLPDSQGKRAGQEAAQTLKARLEEKGIQAKIVMPAKAGTDFHDMWVQSLALKRVRSEVQHDPHHFAA